MRRFLLPAALAVALVSVNNSAAFGLAIALPPQPGQLALTTPVVVTGKVTAIEKDTVETTQPYVGAKEKVTYKVAVVKLDKALTGADNLTHIKIGFIPPAPVQPGNPGGVAPPPVAPGGPAILPVRPGRPGFQQPELKVGQEALFFLAKHPNADFYIIPGFGTAPVDITNDAGKKQLEEVTKVLAVIADPMKGLKSDKAEVRLDTAVKLLTKYRAYPPLGGEVDQVAIDKEQSKLILKIIADADWKAGVRVRPGLPGEPNAMQAFYQLGLTDKDGWKQPMFPRPQPGQPPVDFTAIMKDAFVKWLAGDGKDYVIKKVVPKAKPSEK